MTWSAEEPEAARQPPAPLRAGASAGAGGGPAGRRRAGTAASRAAVGAEDVAALGRVRLRCHVAGPAAVVVTRRVLSHFGTLLTCLLKVGTLLTCLLKVGPPPQKSSGAVVAIR